MSGGKSTAHTALFVILYENHSFGWSEEEDGANKICGVLYLSGAANIELSGNTYSPYIEGSITDYVEGDHYMHISLNPTLDDNLTDSQFADLARAYMQKMGFSVLRLAAR